MESVVPVETGAAMASVAAMASAAMTPCEARGGRNDKKRER